jgi:hypothetical protein
LKFWQFSDTPPSPQVLGAYRAAATSAFQSTPGLQELENIGLNI